MILSYWYKGGSAVVSKTKFFARQGSEKSEEAGKSKTRIENEISRVTNRRTRPVSISSGESPLSCYPSGATTVARHSFKQQHRQLLQDLTTSSSR